ncbi:MAG: hypothetical protein ABFE08_01070 [Armatimonadia bacterium]
MRQNDTCLLFFSGYMMAMTTNNSMSVKPLRMAGSSCYRIWMTTGRPPMSGNDP